MTRRFGALFAALAAASTPVARAGDVEAVLESGLYEVEVRLDLPHLEDRTATKTAAVCIGSSRADSRGLFVLSDNNPLAHCPASNLKQDGNTLTFDIVCEGGNAARASAKYTLAPQGFKGRIAMKMGGKNMIMTETQSGRRVGACAGTGVPRS